LNLARKSSIVSSISFGVCSGAQFFILAISFWYASVLVKDGTYRFSDIFRVVMVILFASSMGGRISAILPDYNKARDATTSIFRELDRKSQIDGFSTEGKPIEAIKEGSLQFDHVYFRYPTRTNALVHRGLTFEVKAGQKIALVGGSGCGKSTCIQLLERFYDPEIGCVRIDGVDIKEINIKALRSCLSLVGQEPVLFDGTIMENIKYGAIDPDSATDEDVYMAAKRANVHEFISSLPNKYNTPVGERGSLLSGGQKQRVAIARALMRNPKILLLDEATSALDAESEHAVQEALDAASVGRTTVIIAHRLSTVQNSDVIFMLKDGVVVEQGTHQELVEMKNHYFKLVQKQVEMK